MSSTLSGVSALLVDAGNTLLQPSESVGETYARMGRPHGVTDAPEVVMSRFMAAFRDWEGPRYQGDGRPFWRAVVAGATGCADQDYFEALYSYYALPEAWIVAEGAVETFGALRARGVTVAVVSNWDTRLRGLLEALGLMASLDAAVISAEVGIEKPDPALYRHACEVLGVAPAQALHIGDHPKKDAAAARAAGCRALVWGRDLQSFRELA